MKSTSLISVIIPTYKDRGRLAKAINSVLDQDYKNIEIIVVDDNNPNSEERARTEAIMGLYEGNDRVLYFRHDENRNGAAARNTGISVSKGDYIAFLDDDDCFLPNKISSQLSFLRQHHEYDAVYNLAQKNEEKIGGENYDGDGSIHILMLESRMFTPTLMFRRAALLNINGFDESFIRHQDYEMLLRFFDFGYRIGCIPEILTVIGTNMGENIPHGVHLENIKEHFLSKFDYYIKKYEQTFPGFANKVYAKHYAGVFLSHIKYGHIFMAIKIFLKYFPKSPAVFIMVIFNSLQSHLYVRKNNQ